MARGRKTCGRSLSDRCQVAGCYEDVMWQNDFGGYEELRRRANRCRRANRANRARTLHAQHLQGVKTAGRPWRSLALCREPRRLPRAAGWELKQR